MTARPLRAPLLLVLVWLTGAVVATSVGVLAVRLVAQQVGDAVVAPLSAAAAAATAPAGPTASAQPAGPAATAPAGPTATAQPAPAPPAATGTSARPVSATFRTVGGSVGLACSGTLARLLFATPADGYALDEHAASGSTAKARFEGQGRRVRVELSCASGRPVLVDERVDEDRGDSGGDD